MSFLNWCNSLFSRWNLAFSLVGHRFTAGRRRKLAFEVLEVRTLLDAKFLFRLSASGNWSSAGSWRLLAGNPSDNSGVPGSSDTAVLSRYEGPRSITVSEITLDQSASIGRVEVHSGSQIVNVNGNTLNVVGNGLNMGVIEVGNQYPVPYRSGAAAGTVNRNVSLSLDHGAGTQTDKVNAGGVWVGTVRNSNREGAGPQNTTLSADVELNVLKTLGVDGSGNVQIGRDATPGSTATMNVTRKTTVAGTTFVGRNTSTTGTLNVVVGTFATGELHVGEGASSNGTVLIQNTKNVDIGAMFVGVGAASVGTITINENSQVRSGATIIGQQPGLSGGNAAKGLVTVADGSYLSIRAPVQTPAVAQPDQPTDYDSNHDIVVPAGVSLQNLTVGDQGTGGLIIQDGSLVDAQNVVIGSSQGSNGGIRVTGTDQHSLYSRLYVPGQITVGKDGTAQFEVLSGAIAVAYKGIIGGTGTKSQVMVGGQDSRFDVTSATDDALTIGAGADVTVQDGGVIEAVSPGGKIKVNGTNLLKGNSKLKAEKMIVEDKQAAIMPGTDNTQIATLTIDADFDSTAGVTYDAELGAPDPSAESAGQSDVLAITGEADLGGDLIVTAPFGTNGYTPGSYFDVLTARGMNGQLTNLPAGTYADGASGGALPALNDLNLAWKVSYGDLDHNGNYEVRLQVVNRISVSGFRTNDTAHSESFVVTLPDTADNEVRIDYAVVNGSATSGVNFTVDQSSGMLVFQPGQMTKTVTVSIVGNTVHGSDKDFFLRLSNPVNTTLASGGDSAEAVLVDPNGGSSGGGGGGGGYSPPPQPITVSLQGDTAIHEGDGATLYVVLSQAAVGEVSISWATRDGTAQQGINYNAAGGTLIFEPGQTFQTIPLATLNDHLVTGNLALLVDLVMSEDFDVDLLSSVPVHDSVSIIDNPPRRVADSAFSVQSGTTFVGGSVLAGVIDPDGLVLSAAVVNGPTHGGLTMLPDGNYSYTAAADYTGPDSFTFLADDGIQASNIGTVSIFVYGAPVVQNQSYDMNEYDSLDYDSVDGGGLLAGASDPAGLPLSVVASSGSTNNGGNFTVNNDGTFSYSPPAAFSGTDGFGFTVSNGYLTTSATATINIRALPRPAAAEVSFAISKNVALSGTLPGADGAGISIVAASGPSANGSFSVSANGSYNYAPNQDYGGLDSFTYIIADQHGHTATGTVHITVGTLTDGYDITAHKVDGYQVTAVKLDGFDITATKVNGYNVVGLFVDGYDITAKKVNGYNITQQLVSGYDVTNKIVDGYDVTAQFVDGYDVTSEKVDGYDITAQWVGGYIVSAVKVDGYDITSELRDGYYTADEDGNPIPDSFVPGDAPDDSYIAGRDWVAGDYGWVPATQFDPTTQHATAHAVWQTGDYGWVPAPGFDVNTQQGTESYGWLPGNYGWVPVADFNSATQHGAPRQDFVTGDYGWVAATQFDANTQQGSPRQDWLTADFGWVAATQFNSSTQEGTPRPDWLAGSYGWVAATDFDPDTEEGTLHAKWFTGNFGWVPTAQFNPSTQHGTAAQGWLAGDYGWVPAGDFDQATQHGRARQDWIYGSFGWVALVNYDPETQQVGDEIVQGWLSGDYGWLAAADFDPDTQQGTAAPVWLQGDYGWVVLTDFDQDLQHGTPMAHWITGNYGWVVLADFDPDMEQGTFRPVWL